MSTRTSEPLAVLSTAPTGRTATSTGARRHVEQIAAALLMVPTIIVGCAMDVTPADDDETTTLQQSATLASAAAFAITKLESESNCAQMGVEYSAAPPISGKSLVRYELQRRRKVGSSYTPWTTVSSGKASTRKISDAQFLPDEPYQYRVLPIYTRLGVLSQGTATAARSITPNCTVPRATSGTTQPVEIYLFTPTDVQPPAALTKQYVENLVFSNSNTKSLFNFLQQVSAGADHTKLIPQVRISGTVHDWKKLSKPKSGYPHGLDDMADETLDFYLSLYEADPAPQYAFIFNTGAGGGDAGGNYITIGAQELIPDSGIGIGAFAHEIGHNLGLRHEVAVNCPEGTYPERLDDIATSCRTSTYSSGQNVMGSASTVPNYFNGLQKRRLGFLEAQNVTWLDVRTMAQGSSTQFELVTSTTTQTSTALQLIMLKFDDADTSYALQYRTAKGFDTNTIMGDTPVPFPEGVFVYLSPGRQVDGIATAASTMLFRDQGPTWKEPVVVTTSSETIFHDPYRKIEVSVSHMGQSSATVTVKRQ